MVKEDDTRTFHPDDERPFTATVHGATPVIEAGRRVDLAQIVKGDRVRVTYDLVRNDPAEITRIEVIDVQGELRRWVRPER